MSLNCVVPDLPKYKMSSVVESRISKADLLDIKSMVMNKPITVPSLMDKNDNEIEVFQPKGVPKLMKMEGRLWFAGMPPRFIREIQDLLLHESDVLICTYPKCGTTWVQHICAQLLFSDYANSGNDSCLFTKSLFLEYFYDKVLDINSEQRLLKTHLDYSLCPKSSKAKYILVLRNPKDAAVSYYFHCCTYQNVFKWTPGSFPDFLDCFLQGLVGYGSYFDYLKSWLPHMNDPNVLVVRYEDMVSDLERSVIEIGRFLGGRSGDLVQNRGFLEKILENSEFEAMKENPQQFLGPLYGKTDFFRKGQTCDWRNHFSKVQSQKLDDVWRMHFENTVVENMWDDEMMWVD